MNLKKTTYLKKATLLVSLLSAIQIPSAFAQDYHLLGATCNRGGNPKVTLVSGSALLLSTGGGNSVAGVVVKGLHVTPILVRDLDTKKLTAVFTIIDKDVIKYPENIRFKCNVRNDVGKIFTTNIRCDTDQNFAQNNGRIFLKRVGDQYDATLPSRIFIDLGKEVPSLNLSGNSQIIYCVIYLDGENTPQGKPKDVVVNSVSISGNQLPIKLENIQGCDAFPNIGI